ncbi:MAG: ATP-binding protein [Bacteroidales bacterium]|nr:ATP-binding protein [Bacteroidales bacterium]
MQTLFKIHEDLVSELTPWVKRGLMDDIDWSARLIGIKGARGIGKTTFLLNRAKMINDVRKCLYVDLNNFYFATHSIISLVDDFRKLGGQTLLLDQVYKYPDWSEELRFCYDNYPDVQIVFTGSPVMRLKEENPQLTGKVTVYSLEGFSFREYINFVSGTNFTKIALADIIANHVDISHEIVSRVKPLAYFNDYLRHGFYPYLLGEKSVSSMSVSLIKTINLVLEIEISYLQQIEHRCMPKLRKLLYLIANSAPFQPNVSKLASEIDTSRATVMNYLLYLKHARLIHLLYTDGDSGMKKPAHIFMQNPNLLYLCNYGGVDKNALYKTFFFNQLGYKNNVTRGAYGDFCVDGEKCFSIEQNKKQRSDVIVVRDMIETGEANVIPIWLFGFLY